VQSQEGAASDIRDSKIGKEGGRAGGNEVGDDDPGIKGVWTGGKKASKGESNIGRKDGGIDGAGDAGQKGGCHGGNEAGDGGGNDAHSETLTAGDKAAFCIGASCGGAHNASKESIREGTDIGGGGGGAPSIKPSSAKP